MAKRCSNPGCPNEFRYFHTGDLYALDLGKADTRFLWLCADCAPKLALAVDADGAVALRQRTGNATSWTAPARHDIRLRIVASHNPRESCHRAGTSAWSLALDEEPDSVPVQSRAA